MIGLQNVVLKRITSSTCDIKGDLRGIEWGEEMEHDNPISIHGKGPWIAYAWNLDALFSSEWAFVLVNWALILSFNYLYHKYTVHSMGRSLGQRWFGLAVVREDGEPLQRMDCGRRSISKLRYLVPGLNLIFLFIDGRHIRRRHTHQSSIDLACASIVVVANSLPPAKRHSLR